MSNSQSGYIRCKGKLLDLSKPKVMGILNVTPDSFYDGGRHHTLTEALKHTEKMLSDGADIIDIGSVSTKPYAEEISEKEELERLKPIIKEIVRVFPEIIISVDTYRSAIAKMAVHEGASIINDISSGLFDSQMLSTIRELQVPYIMMHIQGNPGNMQNDPAYENVTRDVILFLSQRIFEAHKLGINDIIIDPGFGFGKNLSHNYSLLKHLDQLAVLNKPLLIGVSRKSMIRQLLSVETEDALNGTSIIHTIALLKGVQILRVHDVQAAVQCIKVVQTMNNEI